MNYSNHENKFKKIKGFILYGLIGFSLILSGCNLQVSLQSSQGYESSAPKTQSDSAEPETSTVASSQSTSPQTTPTTSSIQTETTNPAETTTPVETTAPAENSTAAETTPIAALPSNEDVQSILQQSADAMLAVVSYNYVASSSSKLGEQTIESETQATMFPAKGDGHITTTQGDKSSTTYLKNNRMYMIDPLSEKWVYMDMPKDPEAKQVTIHERVNDYMTLKKQDNQYLLTSEYPLNALEFYSLTGIELQQKETIDNMDAQGQTMETLVELLLDENFRYVNVTYDQVLTTGGIKTYTFSSYDYSNYNQAEEIIIPDNILEQATSVEAQTEP